MDPLNIQTFDQFGKIVEKDALNQFTKQSALDAATILFDAVNSSVAGLIITDLGGIICYANPAFYKMLEYTQDEILGKNSADLFATKEVKKFSDVIAIIDISRDGTEEFILQTKEGNRRIVEVAASNITSRSGNIAGRMASFVDITARKEIEIDRENLIYKLQTALDKIKTLRGIIPICSSCKKIRDDKGYWQQIENYIEQHSDADFSHGICPECAKKLYPEIFT